MGETSEDACEEWAASRTLRYVDAGTQKGRVAPAASRPSRESLLRWVVRGIPRGAPVGALLHVVGMAWAYLAGSGVSYFGVQVEQVNELVRGQYLELVARTIGTLVATHFILGALLGAAVGRMLSLGGEALEGKHPLSRALRTGLGVLALHTVLLASSVARYPQLYVEAFHARGGALRWAQEQVTHAIPVWLWPTLLLAILLLWTGLELRRALAGWRTNERPGLAQGAAMLALASLCLGSFGDGPRPSPSPHPSHAVLSAAPPPAGRESQPGRGATTRPPNILVVAADSLRPDRLLPLGSPHAVAPTLGTLAQGGVHFSHTYTPLARTFPAWISMLTGQYPHHHGVRHMFPSARQRTSLPTAVPLVLRRAGYSTAVISDFAGDIFTRVDLGFETVAAPYFHFPTLIAQRALEMDVHLLPYVTNRLGRLLFPVIDEFAQNADPGLLSDRALRVVRRLPEPWMAVIFYSTSHFPYAAPAPYYRMFTDPDYDGPFRYHKPHDIAAKALTDQDVRQVRALYDGAVRAIDDEVAGLLARMRSAGQLDDTVVVLTADHGENLYEQGLGMGHGDHLRGEASLRVPLAFWAPGRIPRGVQVGDPVSLVDLAPTLLDLAGVTETPPMDGMSLRSFWERGGGEEVPPTRPVLAETGLWFKAGGDEFYQQARISYPDLTTLAQVDTGTNHEVVLRAGYGPVVEVAKHRALYSRGRKLIYMPTPEGVRWELFDPRSDPHNVHDLRHLEPERAQALRSELLGILADGEPSRIRRDFLVARQRPWFEEPTLVSPPWLRHAPLRLGP